jgi:hypothetical protein
VSVVLADQIHKYPRTRHIEGSRLQPGDEDLQAVPFEAIQGRHLVVEEKMDGANSAISFSEEGTLLVQSRGHFLSGGGRERHFDLFKRWANAHADAFRQALGQRYVAYGEWLYAKHTIFYDQLPHYWMEFDVLDRQEGAFLDTPRRRELLQELPLVQVHVLGRGPLATLDQLLELIGPSRFIRTGHLERLRQACLRQGLDPQRALQETDPSELMEGLYIKVEQEGVVPERYKYIRHSFLSAVLRADSHWHSRPIIPNQLREGAELF